MSDLIQCSTCGHANTTAAYFCTNCHAILIHRCPNCWHEQREGFVCEKCGTNFALAIELAFERSEKESARVERDKAVARALTVRELLLLPFTGFAGLIRLVVIRLIGGLLSR